MNLHFPRRTRALLSHPWVRVCREQRDGDLRAVTSSAGVGVHDLRGLGPAGQPVGTNSASSTVARIGHADTLLSQTAQPAQAPEADTPALHSPGARTRRAGTAPLAGHPAAHNRPYGRKLHGFRP